jgi:hypothetical protein
MLDDGHNQPSWLSASNGPVFGEPQMLLRQALLE